jgi:DNA-directed RNA polymerase specialized sigma24 family protein
LKTGGVIVRMERDFEFGLVGQLRAGDLTAFDAIYDAYNPRPFSFLLRMTRNRAVAEDLLEETWLRLVSGAEDSELSAQAVAFRSFEIPNPTS